ncbi:MAG: dUTP diphosphatase [Acidobacteria bacterium]|nr:dUTP diphosphatase [Acidobacteriota bacterium]
MTEYLTVPITLTDSAQAPAYARAGDAGADLYAAHAAVIPAGGRALVKTGVSVALPDGYALFVQPRSGLALKHGITVLNTPGTVDSGYRGEIGVILFNTTTTDFAVEVGDRVAQAVVQRVVQVIFEPVASLDETERGAGGFGHSGGHAKL